MTDAMTLYNILSNDIHISVVKLIIVRIEEKALRECPNEVLLTVNIANKVENINSVSFQRGITQNMGSRRS